MDNNNSSAGGFDSSQEQKHDTDSDMTSSARSVNDALSKAFGGANADDKGDTTDKADAGTVDMSDSARSVNDALSQAYGNPPATDDTTASDDTFVGTGGVGSAEFLENLRKAHEIAGDTFASNYGSGGTPAPQPASAGADNPGAQEAAMKEDSTDDQSGNRGNDQSV